MKLVNALSLKDLDNSIVTFDLGDDFRDSPTDCFEELSSSAQSYEQRKLRHRESMARLRRERRARIARMEVDETALHKQLCLALARQHQRQSAYAKLVQSAEFLMEAQYSLESELGVWLKYTRFVSKEIGRSNEDTLPSRSVTEYLASDLQQAITYDDEAYENVIKMSLVSIDRARALLNSEPSVTATSCIGWEAKHFVDDQNILHCQLTSRELVSTVTFQRLLQCTWSMLQSPELLLRVPQSAVGATVCDKLSDHAFTTRMHYYSDYECLAMSTITKRMSNGDSVQFITTKLPSHTASPVSEDPWCVKFRQVDAYIDIEWVGLLRVTNSTSPHRLVGRLLLCGDAMGAVSDSVANRGGAFGLNLFMCNRISSLPQYPGF